MSRERKPGAWLPLVYYYLATVIGLGILLFGVVGALRGAVDAALPQLSSEARYLAYETRAPDGAKEELTEQEREALRAEALERARLGGIAEILYGAVGIAVGLPVFVWHLRQARRREPELLGAAQQPASPEPAD